MLCAGPAENSFDAQDVGNGFSRPPVVTPAQKKFWEYLESFNRLPEEPTEEAISVYNAKGIAPDFSYLETSKSSVLGDLAGLAVHRDLFPQRYPWVRQLLDDYSIKIPISAGRFAGSSGEIGQHYTKLIRGSHRCEETRANEKALVVNFLEGLLVVDYLYACGTPEDKREAIKVIDGVFQVNYISHPFRKALGEKLLSPASRDIGWPAIAGYPELIWGLTPILIRGGFSENNHFDKVNFSKWLLRTKGIREMENEQEQESERNMIHNEQVRAGLLSYSIYTAHCHDAVRPRDVPGLVVIEILFKRLFPKDHAAQYRQYLTLLNAAYPKTES